MTKNVGNELAEIEEFLHCSTPQAWLEAALKNQPLLLIDHANCERKAASTAITLMYRHMGKTELLVKMSQLAREELLHFQQVVEILSQRNIEYVRISPSRYAAGLISHIGRPGDQSLIDTLIVGAIIEARSCERFSKLYPLLDAPLSKFYKSLLKSEARHYQDYLQLAQLYSAESIAARVAFFLEVESDLILSEDSQFRFHSGVPTAGAIKISPSR